MLRPVAAVVSYLKCRNRETERRTEEELKTSEEEQLKVAARTPRAR